MGKGDRKTKKGKRAMGSYGVSRKRKSSAPVVISKPKKKKADIKAKTTKEVDPVETIATKKAETKKTTAKKTTTKKPAAKKPAAKKPTAKKTAESKAKG